MTAKFIGLVAALFGLAGIANAQAIFTLDSGAPVESPVAEPVPDVQSTPTFRSVDEEIQAIKKDVLDLSAELYTLEESLLYPANTQVAFFLSMDVGEYFDLESVSLVIDGTEVANYLYTERETGALMRGGVQRLHIENLNVGDHEIVARLSGESEQLRNYRSEVAVDIEKPIGATYVELEITDRVTRQQPEFVVKQWE